MSGMYIHLAASGIKLGSLIYIIKGKSAVYSLGEHIISKIYYIHIAGTFTVSEKRAFYPVCARKKCKLRSSHARTPVIMGMN